MGYICTGHAYEIGQVYSIRRAHEPWTAGVTVYENLLAIRRYNHIDGSRIYEVDTSEPNVATIVREISTDEFIKRCTGRYVDRYGTEVWYAGGQQHRADGPAVVSTDGTKQWWLNGKSHRDDGPSDISSNGDKYWSIDDKSHRDDGPAVIHHDGYQEWWIDNTRIHPLT